MHPPEDGYSSKALLIIGKDIPGTACAVQKMASFQGLPISGKNLPGTMCTVLGVTIDTLPIASHVTTYACHQ